jgi:hypothetical protein
MQSTSSQHSYLPSTLELTAHSCLGVGSTRFPSKFRACNSCWCNELAAVSASAQTQRDLARVSGREAVWGHAHPNVLHGRHKLLPLTWRWWECDCQLFPWPTLTSDAARTAVFISSLAPALHPSRSVLSQSTHAQNLFNIIPRTCVKIGPWR